MRPGFAFAMMSAAVPAAGATIDRFDLLGTAPIEVAPQSRAFDLGHVVTIRLTNVFGARVIGTVRQQRFNLPARFFTSAQTLRIASAGAMFDLFPFRSGFRISGGARVNGNDARNSSLFGVGTARAAPFTPAEAGAIHIDSIADDFAPVLTIGYMGRVRRGLTIGIEAGALFQGNASAAAYNPIGERASTDGTFLTTLERDRLNQQDDFSNYAPSPMAQFSATLKF